MEVQLVGERAELLSEVELDVCLLELLLESEEGLDPHHHTEARSDLVEEV